MDGQRWKSLWDCGNRTGAGGAKVDLPLTDRSLGIRSIEIVNDDMPARIRRLQQERS